MARKKKKREPPPDLSDVSEETRKVYFVYRYGWEWWSQVCKAAEEKFKDGTAREDG